jgi:hypothetical protein
MGVALAGNARGELIEPPGRTWYRTAILTRRALLLAMPLGLLVRPAYACGCLRPIRPNTTGGTPSTSARASEGFPLFRTRQGTSESLRTPGLELLTVDTGVIP